MGLELAQDLGLVMIARAKGRHFLVYNGAEQLDFDAMPPPKPRSVAAEAARARARERRLTRGSPQRTRTLGQPSEPHRLFIRCTRMPVARRAPSRRPRAS